MCPDVDFRPEDRGAPARNERRVHPIQQHHLHQERLRDPGQERAQADPQVPRGVHPGVRPVQHRAQALVSRVHDFVAAQPCQVI